MKAQLKFRMTCNSCKSTVESKLSSLDGVYDVQVDLTNSEAIIYSKNPISSHYQILYLLNITLAMDKFKIMI